MDGNMDGYKDADVMGSLYISFYDKEIMTTPPYSRTIRSIVVAYFNENCIFNVGDLCLINGDIECRVIHKKRHLDFFEEYIELSLIFLDKNDTLDDPVYGLIKMQPTQNYGYTFI